jgi:signal transduction histidine kinase
LWISLPVLVVAWGYLAVPALAYPAVLAQNIATDVLVVVTVWAAGAYAGRRRRQIEGLERRQGAAAHAVTQERARLAYELHDVIGHAITIMVVQAAGAARIMDRDPERARTALSAVERAGADAVEELAQLVHVLSGAGAASSRASEVTRGLADAGALVSQAREALGRVGFDVQGTPSRLEPSVDLAAYCVIREALGNAVKHDGPDAAVDVVLTWEPDRVGIRVTSRRGGDEAPHSAGLSTGHGLAGVRERVRVAGGEIAWSAHGDVFVVTASLPTANLPTTG